MSKKFAPMLAVNIKPSQVICDMMMSMKLEGVRGQFMSDGELLTRQLKPFNNKRLEEKFGALCDLCRNHNIMIEGEFYKHGWSFKEIDSTCRNSKKEEAYELEFHIFDCYVADTPDATIEKRYSWNVWAVSKLQSILPSVKLIPQIPVPYQEGVSAKIIEDYYVELISRGYEGVVLKKMGEPYKLGRSTLKQALFTRIKPEETYDGIVLEIVEREHNLVESEINELGKKFKRQDKDLKEAAGIAQTAIVISPDFSKLIRVQLTRGLKDYETTDNGPSRKEIWDNRADYIGKPIRFVGIPVADMDVPRSPRFDAFRNDIDPICWEHSASESYGITFDPQDFEQMIEKEAIDAISFSRLLELAKRDF